MTFCVKDGRGNSMRVESDHPLDFTPTSPGGPERIGWSGNAPEPDPETEVIIELPPGTKVTITDLARYEIEGDDGALEVVDMRT